MRDNIGVSFEALDRNVSTEVYDASAVNEDLWGQIYDMHLASLQKLVGSERAIEIVGQDRQRYVNTRVDPEILVRDGLWNPGLFRDVTVAVTTIEDEVNVGSRRLVNSVITANNASPPLARIKMWTPPSMRLPKIGGRRYVHLRESVTDREFFGEKVVSGISLAGLYFALGERHDRQIVASYDFPGDPADLELTQLRRLIGFDKEASSGSISGFEGGMVRATKTVREVKEQILAIYGMNEAIESVKFARVSA